MKRRIQEKKHDLALYIEKMKGLSPLEKLSQGYAYASDGNGRTVCRVSQVKPDDELSVYVKDGVIHAKVLRRRRWRRRTQIRYIIDDRRIRLMSYG